MTIPRFLWQWPGVEIIGDSAVKSPYRRFLGPPLRARRSADPSSSGVGLFLFCCLKTTRGFRSSSPSHTGNIGNPNLEIGLAGPTPRLASENSDSKSRLWWWRAHFQWFTGAPALGGWESSAMGRYEVSEQLQCSLYIHITLIFPSLSRRWTYRFLRVC